MIGLKPRPKRQPLYIPASRIRQVRKQRAPGHYPPPHKSFLAKVFPRRRAAQRVPPVNPDPIASVGAVCRRRHAVRDGSPGGKRHCGRAYSGPAHVGLFSLHNNHIVSTLGLDKTEWTGTRMVIDTGTGPRLIRRDALPTEALEWVQETPKGAETKLQDANGARLLTSGRVTLSVKSGASVAPCEFLVADDLSVPFILGYSYIYKNTHAILPADQTVQWIDRSCTSVLRSPGDLGDRGHSASRVLRLVHHTTLDPRSTQIVWVRTCSSSLACA